MAERRAPGPQVSDTAAVYVISVAAELTGLHPQTLRTYERQGLVAPGRTGGGGRRYSARDLEQLRQIAELTAAGIGLEGVRRIVELQRQIAALQQRNAALTAELAGAVEALKVALSTSAPPPATNKLPVLRPSDPNAHVVIWRRGR